MKVQFKILMFIVCLNLATGMVILLGLPGSSDVQAQTPSNATDYEEHFNATDIADKWKASPFTGIPIVGDIFAGFYFLWQNIQYLIDGFPQFLNWLSDTYITDATARTHFSYIRDAFRAIYAILMSVMVVEFIAGRYLTD